jgi:hypothetical protein
MKKSFEVIMCVFIIMSFVQVAVADDDFYGIIENRPDGKVGTWVIGGRSVEVTKNTDLDEDNGPLKVGSCAEVEIDNGKVEDIESEPLSRCNK